MNVSIRILGLALALLGTELPLGAQEQSPAAPPPAAPTTSTQAASTPVTSSQPTPSQATATPALFTSDRLEQLAAPIALYPDSLVAQILMASTYPLEVVEAARWVEQNPTLTGAALEEGLKQNEWDPSVKALCAVPTVLKRMNDNLAWTKDLGDAFLGQKTELMDAIQKMRRKALEAGTLKTTEQQQVTQDDGKVVIQQANPEVIYVPTYSPAVYGPGWYYPTYYYPGWYDPWWGYGIAFGIGFFWGSCCWGGCDWHNHCCHVHCDQFNNFNAHTSIHGTHGTMPTTSGSTATWTHDPAHRAGVPYKSPQVAHAFGAAPGSTRVASTHARGAEHASTAGATAGSASRGAPSASYGGSNGSSSGRSGTAAVAQRSGAGPASGRTTSGSSGGSGRSTTTTMSGGGVHYYGSSMSYRGRGASGGSVNGFHGTSPTRSAGGWGGATRGSTTTFARGWHGTGSSVGAGRSFGGSFGGSRGSFGGSRGSLGGGGHSFGGSFGGGHSSFGGGGRGGGGFGGGGFHGGGHR